MTDLVKLAKDSIKYFKENDKYLNEYDKSLEDNNNGLIIHIRQNGRDEYSGSVYPTRANIGLDIIHEAVNLAIFSNAIDLSETDVDDLELYVYEVNKVVPIQYIEDFGMYHGLLLKYQNNNTLVFRSDYESDFQMFEDAIDRANVDSFDVFSLEKFKMIKHI